MSEPEPADPSNETIEVPPPEGSGPHVETIGETLEVPPPTAGSDPRADPPTPRAPEEPDPSLPVIPGYQLWYELGRGAMGRVYLATQKSPERAVALKVVRPGATEEVEETAARFRQEVEAAAKLEHPNIVSIYEVGHTDEVLFFSMQLIEGGQSLSTAVAERGIGQRGALELVQKVAAALEAAHQRGVVHRDVKPENILVDENGEPFVTDFGLARDMTRSDPRLTATGTIAGTPLYMAPEQARGSSSVDQRADVYSLGATLYELLTLRQPFAGDTIAAVLAKVVTEDPVRMRKIDPRIPRDVETMVEKAMRKDAAHRYPSAGALAADLRAYLDGRPIAARPVPLWYRGLLAARRNKLVTLLLLTTVVALGLMARVQAVAEQQRVGRQQEHTASARALYGQAMEAYRKGEDLASSGKARAAEEPFRLAEERLFSALEQLGQALALGEAWSEEPFALRAQVRRRLLELAEATGDRRMASLILPALREDLSRMAPGPERETLERFTSGLGRIELRPDAPSARLSLVSAPTDGLEFVRDGGVYRLAEAPRGAYQLRLEAEGRDPVLLPLWLERNEELELPVRLLPAGSVPEEMVYVPAGPFFVGGREPGARARSRRYLPGYLIDRDEVSLGDYLAWHGQLPTLEERKRRNPDVAKNVREHPAAGITYEDAVAFAASRGKRLPTEDEWVKAARGPGPRIYAFGDRFDPSRVNIQRSGPRPPGGTPGDVSLYGCRDMAGNVSELTSSLFWAKRQGATARVRRGGAWPLARHYARLTYRDPIEPNEKRRYLGFRCARSLPKEP